MCLVPSQYLARHLLFSLGMTLPRQVLPGASYLVSRRCAQQEFLLKPTALTTAIFKYVLAVAAKRYGILLHAVCVMSNQLHLPVVSPAPRRPG
jgi:hypothetical protein